MSSPLYWQLNIRLRNVDLLRAGHWEKWWPLCWTDPKPRLLIHKTYRGLKFEKALFRFARKQAFRQQERERGDLRMDHIEQQSPKVVSMLPDAEQDLVLETCKIRFQKRNWFQNRKSYPDKHTLTKCPVQQNSFFLIFGGIWIIPSWKNGSDNNRLYDKTLSVHSIYECRIWNCLTRCFPQNW